MTPEAALAKYLKAVLLGVPVEERLQAFQLWQDAEVSAMLE